MRSIVLISALILFSFSSVLSADTAMSETYLNAGMKSYLNGNMDEAIDMFRKANEEDPSNAKAKNALISASLFQGKKLFSEKNYRSSKTWFDKVIAIDSKNAVAKDYLSQLAAKDVLKDYGTAEEPQQSRIEKELEKKSTETKAAAPVQSVSPEARGEQVQKIIIQTESLGGNNEGMDEFISALKQVKKQSEDAGEIRYKLGEAEARLVAEKEIGQHKEKSRNYIFMAVIIALILGFVAFTAVLIMRFYRHRVTMAEHSYKFTAEREAKILQVMNNVVNLENKTQRDAGALLGNTSSRATAFLVNEVSSETVSDENIRIPSDVVSALEDMAAREEITVKQMETDLNSANAHVKASALLACYYYDKNRMLELYSKCIEQDADNGRLMSDLSDMARVLADVEVFAYLVSGAAKLLENEKARPSVLSALKSMKESGKIDSEEDLKSAVESYLNA